MCVRVQYKTSAQAQYNRDSHGTVSNCHKCTLVSVEIMFNHSRVLSITISDDWISFAGAHC
jgi:hypothetical protein